MEESKVFQECSKMPLWCKCGCEHYERLFTPEAQTNNFNLRGSYRVFANRSHRDRYINQLRNSQHQEKL